MMGGAFAGSEEAPGEVVLYEGRSYKCYRGMGSIGGALAGGLIIGVVESLSGLYFGESLGQIGIFLIFLIVLLFRPTGLFGAKA